MLKQEWISAVDLFSGFKPHKFSPLAVLGNLTNVKITSTLFPALFRLYYVPL